MVMLHNMLNMCDGEIRLHAGRWTKYESTEERTWAKESKPEWYAAMALERRAHPTDQGGHFIEFHTCTDEEIEDHRRLGLRPYWNYLKGTGNLRLPVAVSGFAGSKKCRLGLCPLCWVFMATNSL